MWRKQKPVLQTAPQFIQPLPGNLGEIEEGEFLHLEAKVEPVGDNVSFCYSWS
jgi:hypothetical protein